MNRPIRIILAKPGLDGHDRGAKVLAAAFRDAGMEEDADVIALSILSGAHMTIFPRVLDFMKKNELGDVLLTGGGIIPEKDMETLKKKGVGKLFGPGTPTNEAIEYISKWVSENRR